MSPNNDRPCCQVLACASARENEARPITLKAGIAQLAALARKTDRRRKFRQLLRRKMYRPRCNYRRLCRFFDSPPAGVASRPLRNGHKSVAKRRKKRKRPDKIARPFKLNIGNGGYFLGASPAGAPSAAFGSGTGLSDNVCRESITSARCSGFEIPAYVIAVPGIYWRGFARNLLSSSKVHFPPLPFIAAEKLKPPRPSPRSLPTIFQRLGPTRFGPPFSNVWHARHCFAVA